MPTRDEFARLLNLFDTDGDGYLSLPEVRAIFCDHDGGSPLTEEELHRVLRHVRHHQSSVDGSGLLSVDELTRAWLEYSEQTTLPERIGYSEPTDPVQPELERLEAEVQRLAPTVIENIDPDIE